MKMPEIMALIQCIRSEENSGPCIIGDGGEDDAKVTAEHEECLRLAKSAIQSELAKKGKVYNPWKEVK